MIALAQPHDLPHVRELLERVHLTIEGIDDHVATMLVAKQDTAIVGTATLELYQDGALLRSLAVDPSHQGRRLGPELTVAAVRLADIHCVDTIFLLTTAEGFFPKFGFEHVTRDDVPQSVCASVQFRYACSSSSTVMRRRLR